MTSKTVHECGGEIETLDGGRACWRCDAFRISDGPFPTGTNVSLNRAAWASAYDRSPEGDR